MTEPREEAVVQAFVQLSNELVEDYDIIEVMAQLTSSCAEILDVAAAGLLLADAKGTLHLAASSSESIQHLEAFQLQRNEGPCLDCFRDGALVVVPDLEVEAQRWPQFCAAAQSIGVASVHALPMRLRSSMLGALGLFGGEVGRLSEADLALAQALVHVAGVAIVNERSAADQASVNAQLQRALTSRIVVEQAKGVVAQVGSLDMNAAFAVLRRYSRDRGRRLSEVAAGVVDGTTVAAELLEHARAVSIIG